MKTTQQEKMEIVHYGSANEVEARRELQKLLKNSPIPDDQVLTNLGLFLESKNLSRILFMDFLFQKIVDVHGSIFEFGTRWGQNLALFSALRGIYDPFNRHRKIVGFDTFEGFPALTSQDGESRMMKEGQLATTPNYAQYLSSILNIHEQLNPLNHIKKFELRVGDACKEVPRYIKEHPETIIALAFFDFDLYKPTKDVLEAIRPRLTKGSVVAFDELNDPDSPGETTALMETFELPNVRLKRHPRVSRVSYFVVE